MFFSRWIISTLLLATEVSISAAQPLTLHRSLQEDEQHNGPSKRLSGPYQGETEKREIQQNDANNDLSLNSPTTEVDNSTTEACTAALSSVTSVSNSAGFAACYNILDWHQNTGMFQADLRLYQVSEPSGEFAGIAMDDITLLLKFPDSTQFQILMNSKRDLSGLKARQNTMNEIQQYSLMGNFKMQLDLTKLNQTEILSLMVPQIVLQSKASDKPQSSVNMSSTDAVYFVTGQFKDQSTPEIISQVTDVNMANLAIDSSKGFVLPGTTFGIFPTGLIVTGVWCILFVAAFGLGTLGRLRHRTVYRQRITLEQARRMHGKI